MQSNKTFKVIPLSRLTFGCSTIDFDINSYVAFWDVLPFTVLGDSIRGPTTEEEDVAAEGSLKIKQKQKILWFHFLYKNIGLTSKSVRFRHKKKFFHHICSPFHVIECDCLG